MTKKMLFLLALLVFASPIFAQTGGAPPLRRATGGFQSAPALAWRSLPAFAL